MAVDLTTKALKMAIEIISNVEDLMVAFQNLANIEAERSSSGLSLSDFDADYLLSSITKHVDGDTLNGVVNTSIPAIIAFMESNFHDDNLHKARS